MSHEQFIHGRWTRGSGPAFVSTDPASGETVWEGHSATADDVNGAVEAARDAFEGWASLSVDQRAKFLHAFGDQFRKHHDAFGETISRETGKPRWESKTETDAMINKIAATTEAQAQRRGPMLRTVGGARAATHYRPHGVVGVFGPFNFPGHLPNGHIMPALLAGNTVVFKPSELAPLVAQHTAELWHDAGLPPGVFNVVQGARETGQALVAHADIDGIFFTGSFETGRAINRALADQPGKILALEMGGNNPLVVHGVADLDAAAYWTVQSAYLTAGQRCSCARRLIVVDDNDAVRFVDRLTDLIRRVVVGRHTDRPEPFMGPVISDAAARKLLAAQDELLARGGRAVVAMKRIDGQREAMLSPGLTDVTDVTDRRDEEHFGPLLQLVRVRGVEEAVAESNRTRFGLAAGLFSDDRDLWRRFYARARAGVVNWNRPLTGASGQLPFGGVGCSGNHRPSAFFAADYCSYPVASMESEMLAIPESPTPGLPPGNK